MLTVGSRIPRSPVFSVAAVTVVLTVATTTRSKKRSTTKGARAGASRAPTSGQRPPKPSRKAPRPASSRPAGRAKGSSPRPPLLGGHAYDVAGIALVALGVLAGFGMYADLAGPAGR